MYLMKNGCALGSTFLVEMIIERQRKIEWGYLLAYINN